MIKDSELRWLEEVASISYILLLLFKGAVSLTFLGFFCSFRWFFKFTCTSCLGGFSYCLSLGQNVTRLLSTWNSSLWRHNFTSFTYFVFKVQTDKRHIFNQEAVRSRGFEFSFCRHVMECYALHINTPMFCYSVLWNFTAISPIRKIAYLRRPVAGRLFLHPVLLFVGFILSAFLLTSV